MRGLGFGVWGLGVSLGFRVSMDCDVVDSDLGFRILDSGISDLGFSIRDFRLRFVKSGFFVLLWF